MATAKGMNSRYGSWPYNSVRKDLRDEIRDFASERLQLVKVRPMSLVSLSSFVFPHHTDGLVTNILMVWFIYTYYFFAGGTAVTSVVTRLEPLGTT